MAFQSDAVVVNGSGAAVRGYINERFRALFSFNTGPTEPATIYPYQFWHDETNSILKFRDGSNNWISFRGDDGKVILPAGTAGAPSIYFTGQTNTGFYEESDDVIAVSHDGTQVCAIGKNMQGGQTQADCFVYGSGVGQTVPPGEADVSGEAGLMIAKDGVTQIGANEKRPLTINRIISGTIGSYTGLLGFHVNGTQIQQITTNGSTISYNTGSDYRLKENVITLTGAKARLNQLRVCRFNFIALPGQTVDGFIAHEAQEVVPEAVTGSRDAVNPDGSPEYQGIDQSKFVPLLTAALQEAFAEIDALRTRVETLEAG